MVTTALGLDLPADGVDPHLAGLLSGLGLDVRYVRGEGTRLFDAAGRVCLDFAGAYGALPFGHNPEPIWAAIAGVRQRAEPSLTQPSLPAAAAELATALARCSGLPHAFLTNSGAESVEAAIKLVRAATRRTLVVSTGGAFHGKTLGALSATGRPSYQAPFGAPAHGFTTVPFGSVAALRRVFAERGPDIAGFLVEPIQGEGGIVPAPPGYLAQARALCTAHGAKLVFDEVQTGLGRTGRMFAAEHTGVRPDVLTLAKALGGGIVPAGAVLYGADCLTEDFSLRHTSTFGGNALCARVGLATVDLLSADDQSLVRAAARRGALLRAGLVELRRRHPSLVVDVRGAGLLLGVELTADPDAFRGQGLFRSLAHAEGLAAYLCGFLLREAGVRVAPAYFAARVLRVEPPLTVSEDECATFLAALGAALDLIAAGDSHRFFAHLHEPPPPPPTRTAERLPPADDRIAPPKAGEPRWAFLGHPTDVASYRSFDPALCRSGEEVRALFARMRRSRSLDGPAALFVGACRVVADTGESTHGELFALPHDARALLDLPTARAADLIGRAVAEAARRGAQLVGLGAYTSIVTANATLLGDLPVPVTTGNAYTAASACDGVTEVALRRGLDLSSATCAVLGAPGAIGRAMTLLLAERVGRLVLVGNPRGGRRTTARLAALADEIAVRLPRPDTTVDAESALAAADLVVAATSTPDLLVRPAAIRHGAIVCDVSQPANVSPELAARRPDVAVFAGGLVVLPGGRALGLSTGLPTGVTYACTAETMILACLRGAPVTSFGDRLGADLVARLSAEGRRLGFRLHLPDPCQDGSGP